MPKTLFGRSKSKPCVKKVDPYWLYIEYSPKYVLLVIHIFLPTSPKSSMSGLLARILVHVLVLYVSLPGLGLVPCKNIPI